MEAVQDVQRSGQALGDDPQIGLPQVRADKADLPAEGRSSALEEDSQRRGFAVFANPQQPSRSFINLIDQRPEFAPGHADFIDSQRRHPPQLPVP